MIALTISILEVISSSAKAGMPGRFCLQITKTNSPNVGTTHQIEVEVDKVSGNVSSLIGRTCYINPTNNNNNCVAVQGAMTIDSDGSINMSSIINEQVQGGQGINYITTSGEFNIDPITLKGQGVNIRQTTDGKTVTFLTSTHAAEIVTCSTPTKESISESKQLKSFIRRASRF